MKPNIVFILADDMGAWAMSCAGDSVIKTPNLDKLSANGLRFQNFFCASPVCSPARASILSGRMPSAHGVHDWLRGGNLDMNRHADMKDKPEFAVEYGAVRYMDGIPCYTDILAEQGYDCALSGKWHLGDSATPQHGFDKWYTIARGGCNYMKPDMIDNGKLQYEDTYVTDLITDKAIEFIDSFTHDTPFYLSVHYTAPHSPWEYSQHKPEHLEHYMNETFDHIPDIAEHKYSAPTAPKGRGEKRLELLRGYYAAITALDEGVGKIFDKLTAENLLDNTIIFFCGDNGMNMGHHGIWGKGNGTFPANMYDTSVKVPFIAYRSDGWLKNHVVDEIVSQYDIYPTIADLLNVTITDDKYLPGKSFLPILEGVEYAERDSLVVFDEYGPTRMIRTDRDKLVLRMPYGPDEYYDIINDSNEDVNLISSEDYQERIKYLKGKLITWFAEYSDPNFDGSAQGVTGFGQMYEMGVKSNGQEVWWGKENVRKEKW